MASGPKKEGVGQAFGIGENSTALRLRLAHTCERQIARFLMRAKPGMDMAWLEPYLNVALAKD